MKLNELGNCYLVYDNSCNLDRVKSDALHFTY